MIFLLLLLYVPYLRLCVEVYKLVQVLDASVALVVLVVEYEVGES